MSKVYSMRLFLVIFMVLKSLTSTADQVSTPLFFKYFNFENAELVELYAPTLKYIIHNRLYLGGYEMYRFVWVQDAAFNFKVDRVRSEQQAEATGLSRSNIRLTQTIFTDDAEEIFVEFIKSIDPKARNIQPTQHEIEIFRQALLHAYSGISYSKASSLARVGRPRADQTVVNGQIPRNPGNLADDIANKFFNKSVGFIKTELRKPSIFEQIKAASEDSRAAERESLEGAVLRCSEALN